jgi:murein DD-endopeptidase MepM/ murein hydrolase activator NlpD
MKSADPIKAGSVLKSASDLFKMPHAARSGVVRCRWSDVAGSLSKIFAVIFLILGNAALAQSLYKYQDENGDWIYTDRPPGDEQKAEIRELPTGAKAPTVTVSTTHADGELQFIARNDYYAPVEVVLALDELMNVQYPTADQVMRWLVDPRSTLKMMALPVTGAGEEPAAEFRFIYLHGDPRSRHSPRRPYRAPFAVANDYSITQAFPIGVTHNTVDSRYAVDVAMPVGTDIHAARGGVVFEVASTNFRGGIDPDRDAASANIVRILHDDGTHAVYAHLNWNSIRVKPGDTVERGQYIADSGNTGFSSGPHLHFAVLQNVGMRMESVPVVFEGPNSRAIPPAVGNTLTAY